LFVRIFSQVEVRTKYPAAILLRASSTLVHFERKPAVADDKRTGRGKGAAALRHQHPSVVRQQVVVSEPGRQAHAVQQTRAMLG
jgi:hypothetical protein